ncbi:MAG TPA: branched-chain amino acid ABC transporter permease [Gaiellaceae bacterium]|nr:branched-chain amino acid ABC transporter permease [Gaiellaceae bacterium]
MTEFVQYVVVGLANGGVYATLALALVLIHRATGIVNFAQGEMGMFATFIAWSLINHHGLPYWVAFFVTLLIAFLGGAGIHQAVIRPLERGSALTVVMATIALLIVLNGLAGWIWAPDAKFMQSPFPLKVLHVGGVVMNVQDLGVIGVSLLCVAVVFLFFRFTRLGLQMRAAAVGPATSRLLGIRVPLMLSLGWGLAAMLSAVSGMMAAPFVQLDPNFMLLILTYSFAAAVLGGIDSPVGSVVGAFLIGVGISVLSGYARDFLGGELQLPVALAVLLGVLVLRPAGLFGRVVVRRV